MALRCPGCLFRPEDCLCAEIPRLTPPVPFLILRHASEIRRTTNSGRWAATALAAPVLDYGRAGTEALDEAPLSVPGTWVLFPSPEPTPPSAGLPRRLVVLDASWSQARRMIQRVPALQAMPRLSLPAPAAERLRAPTVAGGMSTLEAVARALAWLGRPEDAARLDALMAAAVARQRRLRGQPLSGGTR
ncbi:MAG: DTW domain-containing protein [Deltaproteobacteria bacterium]|nr:DTW domain-containing protein [Deltaproteobacteria bacterium]